MSYPIHSKFWNLRIFALPCVVAPLVVQAACGGDPELCSLLLDAKADPTRSNQRSSNVLKIPRVFGQFGVENHCLSCLVWFDQSGLIVMF